MSETISGLRVYRPAINLNHNLLDTLLNVAESNGIPTPALDTTGLFAYIVSPGELRNVMRFSGADKDTPVRPLADYLANYLPPSVHEPLTVPTLPLSITSTMVRRPSRKTISVAAHNPAITPKESPPSR